MKLIGTQRLFIMQALVTVYQHLSDRITQHPHVILCIVRRLDYISMGGVTTTAYNTPQIYPESQISKKPGKRGPGGGRGGGGVK